MLQQTQVQTVIPYYRRWMERFPNIEALAGASEEEVLHAWEGLGYYTRARNLRLAAQGILTDHHGKVPDSREELRRLPGIGNYTAGAVASIAFQRQVPAVDANCRRILCRLYCLNPKAKELEDMALDLMGKSDPAIFNQALMELGALVCTAAAPRCRECPLKALCLACKSGRQGRYPTRVKPLKVQELRMVLGIIEKSGRVYIQKRSEAGLFAGMWEFPGGRMKTGEEPEKALRREVRETLAAEIRGIRPRELVRHSYTRFRVVLHPFSCRLKGGANPGDREHQWINPEKLHQLPFPAANRRVIRDFVSSRPSGSA